MMSNLVKANRDPNVLIKEIDKAFIHVRLRKTSFDPNDPKRQFHREIIQIFHVKEFEQMEANRYGRNPMDWVNVAGFDEAYVVHDGRLLPKEEEVKNEVADAIDEVVQAEVKAAIKKEVRKRNVRANISRNKAK